MNKIKSTTTYKQAGVNISAGNEFVEALKPITRKTRQPWADGSLGGFGAIFDPKLAGFRDPLIVSSTDGVGTKCMLAIELQKFDTIGIDCVAMCVNDLLVEGAKPLTFLDYYATGKLNIKQATEIIYGIAEGCKQAECVLSGGETAEMPGFYENGKFDIAGFVIGAVEREEYLSREQPEVGDLLIGLPSSGFHSNGYSLIRKIVKDNKLSLNSNLGQQLLTPTKIYYHALWGAYQRRLIKRAAHITGGGIMGNLLRIIPEGLYPKVDRNSWLLPEIFKYFKELGKVPEEDFNNTFNCGIGVIAVVSKENYRELNHYYRTIKQENWIIGEITVNPRQINAD